MTVSKESLDDYASFEQVVKQEMIAGIINEENAQLLSGDGIAMMLTRCSIRRTYRDPTRTLSRCADGADDGLIGADVAAPVRDVLVTKVSWLGGRWSLVRRGV